MADLPGLERSLFWILVILEPYLDDIVLIGGWVPHVYRRFGGFPSWEGKTSLTSEVDVLVRDAIPPSGRSTLPETLETAGFGPQTKESPVAVWIKDQGVGEKVEFLVPSTGIAMDEGRVKLIGEQGKLGAVALDALWLLSDYTQRLCISKSAVEAAGINVSSEIACQVPMLGAYLLNKGATFMNRRSLSNGDNQKRFKDLLYIRDLMAAGQDVVRYLEADIQEVVGSDRRASLYANTAGSNVKLVLSETNRRSISEAGAMLSEREGMSAAAAAADIEGHLTDFTEMVGRTTASQAHEV